MSEFSVHRTADTIPALKYCLILDGERIAGGKPDYRGNNHLISWSTRETYGPIDQLKAENKRLRELVRDYEHCSMHADCDRCEYDGTTSTHCPFSPCFPDIDELRELGVEVDDG